MTVQRVEQDLAPLLAGFPEISVEAVGPHTGLRVRAATATALVSLHGGQLVSYVPDGHGDLLWCSPRVATASQAIRGGVPVCWPYFGRQGQCADAPQHGFARNGAWRLERIRRVDGDIELELSLPADARSPLRASQTLRVGAGLVQRLVTRNEGEAPVSFTCALHSYFQVSDALQVRATGLRGLPYVDKYDGGRHVQRGDWDLHDPRDPGRCDRLYERAGNRFELIDPQARRTMVLETAGSRSLVLWNPGAAAAASMPDIGVEWQRFVCLETANAGADVIELAPGAAHALQHTLHAVANA